jgi:hypothetical protein
MKRLEQACLRRGHRHGLFVYDRVDHRVLNRAGRMAARIRDLARYRFWAPVLNRLSERDPAIQA